MLIPKPIARIFVLAPLFFGGFLLLAATGFYPPVFRALGNTFLHRFGSGRIAQFTPIDDPARIADTGLSVGSDALGTPAYGSTMKISSIREGYAPTAMILALVLATPVAWRTRARMLLFGFVIVQLFVGLRMSAAALYGFSKIGTGDRHLLEVGALGSTLLRRANQVISTDMHISYVFPVVVWVVLVTTMTDLWKRLRDERAKTGSSEGEWEGHPSPKKSRGRNDDPAATRRLRKS